MIESFTRANLPQVQSEIDNALKQVGEKLGITFSMGGIRFTSGKFTTKLTANASSDQGEIDQSEWNANAWKFGFQNDDFGKSFVMRLETYKIVGIKPRSKKYPILGMDKNGKTFKFPASIKGAII